MRSTVPGLRARSYSFRAVIYTGYLEANMPVILTTGSVVKSGHSRSNLTEILYKPVA